MDFRRGRNLSQTVRPVTIESVQKIYDIVNRFTNNNPLTRRLTPEAFFEHE